MKAQMTIEFVISAVVFFSIVLYVLIFLNSSISEYREESYANGLQSMAMQISDLLVHNRAVGLSGGYPVINTTLIDKLQERCDNSYHELLGDLEIEHHRIRIRISESDTGGIILDCPSGISITELATKAGVTRLGVLNGTNQGVTVDLLIW